MHSVILVEFRVLLDLAHHNDNRRSTSEDAIVGGALVSLPGTDEMRDALVKELGIDLDLRHLDGTGRGRWQNSVISGFDVGGRLRRDGGEDLVAAPKF
jgi:hypothetical protein